MTISSKIKAAAQTILGGGNEGLTPSGTEMPVSPQVQAVLAEEQRALTKEEQQFAVRCGKRAAGGQKILNFLARGTRVNNSTQANLLLGSAYNLY